MTDEPKTAVQLRAELHVQPGIAAWNQKKKPFNDLVTDAVSHLLQTTEEFPLLVLSIHNSETIEGTKVDDRVKAATILRESVPAHSPIATVQTARLRKSMGVALRRLKLGERQLLLLETHAAE